MKKISFISTIYNEEKNVERFLDSIINQSRIPDEIIIVDGGSTDKTVKLIKKVKEKTKIPFEIIVSPKANIAKGRNIAIRKAKHELIFVSDAGCVVNKGWIKETLKFFPKADVVAGNHKAIIKNNFEFFQGLLTVNKVDRITRMSSRNLAFKKKCWKKANGYPERCLTGEDTLFNIRLKKVGCNMQVNPRKDVAWEMRPNLVKFFKQFYKYGQGDKIQGNIWKIKKNLISLLGLWAYIVLLLASPFLNWYVFLGLIAIPLLYLGLKSFRVFLKTKKISSFLFIPILEFVKRISYFLGATFG